LFGPCASAARCTRRSPEIGYSQLLGITSRRRALSQGGHSPHPARCVERHPAAGSEERSQGAGRAERRGRDSSFFFGTASVAGPRSLARRWRLAVRLGRFCAKPEPGLPASCPRTRSGNGGTYGATAERPDCTPDYAAAPSLAALTVSLMGSITASRCNATAITQPNASQLTDTTQRAEPHGTPSHAIVQQRFFLAADLQVDLDPSRRRTTVQSRRSRRRGPTAR